METKRKADFWDDWVITAVVACLAAIFVTALIEAFIMAAEEEDQAFRQGFYLGLAGKPTDKLEKDEYAAKGILLADKVKEVFAADFATEKAKVDNLVKFTEIASGSYRCDVFSNQELIRIMFSSEEEKEEALKPFFVPIRWAKTWQISGLIYWLVFSLVVSITYLAQCNDCDAAFWRVPYNKIGTYLIILLLLPGLLLCVGCWLIIKCSTSDLTKLAPKRKPKGKITLEIPDIRKAEQALVRLRQKLEKR